MFQEEKTHVLIQRLKVYRLVPKAYMNKDCSDALYKSFARFPRKNLHWQFETINYQGREFLLESVEEVAFDRKGRVIHSFRETQEELTETTTVYIAAANDKTVEVHACSNGRVTIFTSVFEGNTSDDPNAYWIVDGNLRGLTDKKWTSAQKQYMALEDHASEYSECDTIERRDEEDEFTANAYSHQVIERDQYGKPLREISWECDEMIAYITHEYIYAE